MTVASKTEKENLKKEIDNLKSTEIKSLMKIPESYQLLGFVTAGIEGKASSIKKNVPKKKITHYEYFNK